MGSESFGSSCNPSLVSPFLNKLQNVENNTLERVQSKGVCFFCHEEGHWARDCPSRSNSTPGSGSPTAIAGRRSYPDIRCACGDGVCVVLTSRTAKNPGRDFYRCPGKQSVNCGFFKWCDEIASGQTPKFKSPIKAYQQRNDDINALDHGMKSPMNNVKQHSGIDHLYPMCSCGAKKCILLTVHDGENAGRKYFACPIKKGQGACNHFQWFDDAMTTKKIDHSDHIYEKPNLLSKDNKDGTEAIAIAEDIIDHVSPIRQDQIFRQELHASDRKAEGAYNHFKLFENYPNPLTLDNKLVCEAINVAEAKDKVAPVSPLLTQDLRYTLQISPLKFGNEGNLINEHSAFTNSPCFKCGGYGHSKHNCLA